MPIRLIYHNLGTLINYLGPLVPLGPLGLMGPHVPITKIIGLGGSQIDACTCIKWQLTSTSVPHTSDWYMWPH